MVERVVAEVLDPRPDDGPRVAAPGSRPMHSCGDDLVGMRHGVAVSGKIVAFETTESVVKVQVCGAAIMLPVASRAPLTVAVYAVPMSRSPAGVNRTVRVAGS